MELDITDFFNAACPRDYSASVAEIGVNAGPDTWRAANDDANDYPMLDTAEKLDAFRAFVRSSGGWDDKEVAAFSDQELTALCIQWISADIREAGIDTANPDWNAYAAMCEDGNASSRLFDAGGKVFYYIGE